jgi:hypothetical protein
MLIDIEISEDRNVIKKEAYNRKSVLWNVKTKVIPVKKGTTGTTSKSFRNI